MKRTGLFMVVSLLLPVVLAAGCGGSGNNGGGSSSKAITAFGIVNPAATGTVNESAKTISVTVPYRTATTALAATFTTTGMSVVVGSTVQVSGVTLNNFSIPVVYTINAADGSTQNYTVTVTVASSNVVLGTPITSPTVPPITSFAQTLVSHDTGTLNATYEYYQEILPGQANVWDIDNDFTLVDGGDNQFSSALWLFFSDDGSSFGASAQSYSGLTFYGPLMGTAQGVTVAAVSDGLSTGVGPLTGSYSAFLNATSDSRLMQTLDLTSVVSGATITLTWDDSVNLNEGNFIAPLYTPSYRVVIRDTAGAEREVLSSTTDTTSTSGGSNTADLSAYAGENIVLSLEERSMPGAGYLTMIDSISVQDDTSVEYVTNGDFETGDLTGWTTNTPAEVQNMTSSAETHYGLDVKRSFYTVSNKSWGRWVDVFVNNTTSDITTTLTYESVLGSSGTAILYDTPLTNRMAISAWDSSQTTRDIGIVFGKAAYTFDGSDTIDVDYNITVPANGGRVALVNFIILGTYDTSLTTLDPSVHATEIDNEAQNIVNNFWTDPQYRNGMTQQQIDAIKNF